MCLVTTSKNDSLVSISVENRVVLASTVLVLARFSTKFFMALITVRDGLAQKRWMYIVACFNLVATKQMKIEKMLGRRVRTRVTCSNILVRRA